jgi:hypothetical protein
VSKVEQEGIQRIGARQRRKRVATGVRWVCLGEVGAAKDRRLHAVKTWPSHTAKQMDLNNSPHLPGRVVGYQIPPERASDMSGNVKIPRGSHAIEGLVISG